MDTPIRPHDADQEENFGRRLADQVYPGGFPPWLCFDDEGIGSRHYRG